MCRVVNAGILLLVLLFDQAAEAVRSKFVHPVTPSEKQKRLRSLDETITSKDPRFGEMAAKLPKGFLVEIDALQRQLEYHEDDTAFLFDRVIGLVGADCFDNSYPNRQEINGPFYHEREHPLRFANLISIPLVHYKDRFTDDQRSALVMGAALHDSSKKPGLPLPQDSIDIVRGLAKRLKAGLKFDDSKIDLMEAFILSTDPTPLHARNYALEKAFAKLRPDDQNALVDLGEAIRRLDTLERYLQRYKGMFVSLIGLNREMNEAGVAVPKEMIGSDGFIDVVRNTRNFIYYEQNRDQHPWWIAQQKEFGNSIPYNEIWLLIPNSKRSNYHDNYKALDIINREGTSPEKAIIRVLRSKIGHGRDLDISAP